MIVSKSEFAKLSNVDKTAVSHWIKSGKISGKAIVGEGRMARIDVEAAQDQLRTRIDPGQRLGNGFSTRLTKAATASQAALALRDQPEDSDDDGGTDDVDRRLKLSKLEALERSNRIAALEEAAAAGTYVDAAEARAEMGRIAATMMRTIEGWAPVLATTIASKFKIDARDVRCEVEAAFYEFRLKAAEAADTLAGQMPATV